MAKNTFLEDLMAKMPKPEATFPTLQAQGQAGLADFNASAPPPFDPSQFFGDRSAGSQPVEAAPTSPFVPNAAIESMTPDFARQMNVPSEIISQPSIGQTQAPTTEPQADFAVARPSAPAALPTPQVEGTSLAPTDPIAPPAAASPFTGSITRDSTGEVFGSNEEGLTRIQGATVPEGGIGPRIGPNAAVASLDAQNDIARQGFEDRIAATNPQINPADVSAANAARGRPINVSEAEVQIAQRQMQQQESERAADRAAQEYGKSLPLGGESIGARDEKIAEFRAAFLDNRLSEAGGAGGGGGQQLSVSDQIAISKENRAARGEAREVSGAQSEAAEGRDRDFSAAEALFAGNQNIADVGQKAQRQAGQTGTTGIAGAIFAKLKPGSKAADMQANLDTLQADAAFGALQTMRDNSKTGGALGAISQRELDLLGAAQRSLAASQSPEQLQTNIAAYLKLRSESMARVKAGFAKEYGQIEANRIFGGGSGESSSGAIPNDRDSNTQVDAGLQQYFN